MKRYYIDRLEESLINILKSNNVGEAEAKTLSSTMIEADIHGVHSHGVSIFPAYIKKIRQGGFNLHGKNNILRQTSAFSLIDADNQFGMISATDCMNLALEKAKESGVYTVFARNANTFGAGFKYAKMATDMGMIGICFANTPSQMPAWGGREKLLGTNPFAIGIPAKSEGPILIDMATSVVAKSKINEIRKQGGEIPLGWAVDEDGNPTTDPEKAIRGMVLPMAEHKGSAIAMAIDIISGLLSGAGYLNNINRFYSDDNKCMNVGHCFIAINPDLVFGDGFSDKMDEYIKEVHSSGENVLYPGEPGNIKRKLSGGISVELSDDTVSALQSLFNEYNIEKGIEEYVG